MTESCSHGAWKNLCPEFAVDFRDFDLSEKLSKERLKLVRKVDLDELEEEDIDSLLETIGEELSTEKLDELEKQRCQLEDQQQPAVLSTRHLTVKDRQRFFAIVNQAMDHLEEINPYFEPAGLTRCKVAADLTHYEQILYEKRREATQATLDAFFGKASLPEASASNEPPASDEPQPSTSTDRFTRTNVPSLSPSSSDTDNPDIV